MNLHLGCGTVYLDGWLNVDYFGVGRSAAPSSYQENVTDIQHYYRYPYKPAPFGEKPHKRQVIVDVRADATKLPFQNDSVDRILSVNFINHVRFQDFQGMIHDWHRVLKTDGTLIIDVDDVVGMCRNVVNANTMKELEKALRYLHCHSRTSFDSHLWGYTEEYLTYLLEPVGFKFAWRNDEYIHHDADYPRFLAAYTKKNEME